VSEDSGIEPRTVATTALTVRRSNYSTKSHPQEEITGPPISNLPNPSLWILGGGGGAHHAGGMLLVDEEIDT
jgi:hypothetical protein